MDIILNLQIYLGLKYTDINTYSRKICKVPFVHTHKGI